jgi:hypothetical protein
MGSTAPRASQTAASAHPAFIAAPIQVARRKSVMRRITHTVSSDPRAAPTVFQP